MVGKDPVAAERLFCLFNEILNSETGKVWYNRPYPGSEKHAAAARLKEVLFHADWTVFRHIFPIVDGVGRVVYNYATTIAQKGHECYVVAPMTDTGYLGGFPFELIEFVSHNVPTQRQYQTGIPLLDPHYNLRIQKVPLDIIHAHSPFIAGQEALRIGKRRGIPVVGTFHSKYYDDFYKLTRQEMLADIGVRYVVGFYERCDEVWTVSYSSADTLRDYGYKGDIVVMPNGTPDVQPSNENMAMAKAKFGLGDKPIFMYCGQMNWKRIFGTFSKLCIS